ncbi:MAG: Ig-like domain-containing domain [Gemmatimonadaceae bacterium]
MRRSPVSLLLAFAAAAATACTAGSSSTSTTAPPSATATEVRAVVPAGGATGVNPSAPIVLTFTHAMQTGMAAYVSLHEGTLTGAAVAGVATWSTDRMTLTFTPTTALKAHTTYVLHMGGGMVDASGKTVDLSTCPQFGGQPATGQMMGGGGMMNGGEMGQGWQTPGGASYGMVFTFTTA